MQLFGEGPLRFDGIETMESQQQWAEDMDIDVSCRLVPAIMLPPHPLYAYSLTQVILATETTSC